MKLSRFFAKANQPVSPGKQTATLLILLSGALILFGAVLLTSQKYEDGDEAVVGVMARHILTKGERPLFFYGQVYGGGGAIEAYLATIPFTLFGTSPVALKSVALCIWLVTITLCYLFCLRRFNYVTALFSSILLITATALIEWHLKMRGGYAAIPMFFMVILMCFSHLVDQGAQGGWPFLLLGLFCGAAYYNLEIIFPFLLTVLLFSLLWRHIFWKWKPALLTAAGFMISASPLLLFNLTHDFVNLRYVLGQGAGSGGQNLFSNLYTLLFIYLPGFFVGRNVDDYVSNPPILAYLEYVLYLTLFICLSIKLWPHARKLAGTFLASAGASRDDLPADIETLLAAYLVIYLTLVSVSGNIGLSPRYLLPLYPALAILAARGVHWLWMDQNRLLNVTGILLSIALVVFGSINHLAYIGQSRVNDDVLIRGQGLVNRESSGETISKMIEFLNRRQISRVWCTYFVQWRLLFESNEAIVASSDNLIPGADTLRYPLYDAIVWEHGGPQAVILHHEDAQLASLEQSMTPGYEREMIGDYVVLIPK
jgi:hypothetical protein